MFAKLWEKEKNHKEQNKDMKEKNVSILHPQPHHSSGPEISLYPWLKNFSWTFKNQSEILETESLNKNQTKQKKKAKQKNLWKLLYENAICFQRESL